MYCMLYVQMQIRYCSLLCNYYKPIVQFTRIKFRFKIYIYLLLANLKKEILTFAEENDLIFEEDIVTKRGITTGTTYGYLMDDTLSFTFYDTFFSNCYTIENINDDDPFFLPGDSGSGVYVIKNGKPIMPLGIAFAYMNWQTAVCNISNIVDRLGLQIVRFVVNEDESTSSETLKLSAEKIRGKID